MARVERSSRTSLPEENCTQTDYLKVVCATRYFFLRWHSWGAPSPFSCTLEYAVYERPWQEINGRSNWRVTNCKSFGAVSRLDFTTNN